jgi:uncharacterized protein (TIGR04255 family)
MGHPNVVVQLDVGHPSHPSPKPQSSKLVYGQKTFETLIRLVYSMIDIVTKSEIEPQSLHFKRPPIIEAVIAINVSPLSASMIAAIKEAAPTLQKMGYKQRDIPVTMHQFQMHIVGGKSQVSGVDTFHGIRFDSGDGLYAVQFNLSGFVFSRLGEYQTWEQFRSEARRLWSVFSRFTDGVEVLGFGVRYINKLFIPLKADLSAFLRVYPHLPDDVPQTIHEEFMRIAMEIPSPKGVLVHQQTLLPPEREGYAAILLDNDFQFPCRGISTEEVWDSIEKIRVLKDDYFVKFLTPAMMETFNA